MYYTFSNGSQAPVEFFPAGSYMKPNAGLHKDSKWSDGIDGPPKPTIGNQNYIYTPAPVMYPQCVSAPPGFMYYPPQNNVNTSPLSPNSNKGNQSPESKQGKQGVANLAERTRTKKLREQLTPIILNHINEKTEDFFDYPNLASKVIRAFMEKDSMELSLMLKSKDLFEARFDEAIAGIKADEASFQAAVQTSPISQPKTAVTTTPEVKTNQNSDDSPKEKAKTVVVVKHNMNTIASLKEEIEKLKSQRDGLSNDLEEMKRDFDAKEKRQNLIIQDLKRRSSEFNDVDDLAGKMEYVKNKEEELKTMRITLEQQFKKTKAETKAFREQKEKVRKMREDLVKENNTLDEKIALFRRLKGKEIKDNVEEQYTTSDNASMKSRNNCEEKVPSLQRKSRRKSKSYKYFDSFFPE